MSAFLLLLQGLGPLLIPVLHTLEPILLQQIQTGFGHLNNHLDKAIATHPANQV
jgi:hypothetical protein